MEDKTYLFVGGAPRSGTTFLFNVMSQHSDICPHKNGESYFFMDKDHPLRKSGCNYYSNSISEYEKAFAPIERQTKYLLDGTDHLIYQEEMIEVVSKLPRKKMIFILREPASRVLSSFQFTKNNLSNFKKNISFKEYLEAISSGNTQEINDWFYNEKRSGFVLKRELEYSHYYRYLTKWRDAIGQENIFFIQFESFVKHQETEMSKLYSWLNLEDKLELIPANKNAAISIKHPLLHRWIMKGNELLPKSQLKTKLKHFYLSLQKGVNTDDKENDDLVKGLKQKYEDSNRQLLTIADFDLNLW